MEIIMINIMKEEENENCQNSCFINTYLFCYTFLIFAFLFLGLILEKILIARFANFYQLYFHIKYNIKAKSLGTILSDFYRRLIIL